MTSTFPAQSPASPFLNQYALDALLQVWTKYREPETETLLQYLANHDFDLRYRWGWNRHLETLVGQRWTIQVNHYLTRMAGVQSGQVHWQQILPHAADLRPQRQSRLFDGRRLTTQPVSMNNLAGPIKPIWHYAAFLQAVWIDVFPLLPEELIIDPARCWQHLRYLHQAYQAYCRIQFRDSPDDRQEEEVSYVLALYEATLWLILHRPNWTNDPLGQDFLDQGEVIAKKSQALQRLALSVLTHCHLAIN